VVGVTTQAFLRQARQMCGALLRGTHTAGGVRPAASVRYLLGVVILAAAYYGAAKAGLGLAYLHGSVTALWPPVGVGIAALVLFGPRLWPGVVIGDLLVADFGTPLGTVLGQTVGNTLEVVLAAVLLRRLAGARVGLTRVREVFALVVCAAVGTLVSACFGAASLRLGHVIRPGELAEVWRTWWLSDFSGALVVTPVFLTLANPGPFRFGQREAREATVLLVVLVALAELPSQRDVPYVVFPALIWAALRFGPRGASLSLLLASSLTVLNTANNNGPFVRQSITDSLLSTQLFIATGALSSLVLAALTAERATAAAALAANEHATRRLADEQSALRRIATLVAADAPPRALFARVTEEVGRLLGVPSARVVRFEDDGRATIVGGWTRDGGGLPVGATLPLEGDTALARVRRSGGAERIAGYERLEGELGERLRARGYRASVAAPVRVAGVVWGALVASAHAADDLDETAERRLCDVAELVAQALANADAREMLAASRARIVEAGDAERRRLERNLHDGAQQRLVTLALQLRLIGNLLERDPSAAHGALDAASSELHSALEELRELARGIHPAVLTERGLEPAVAALAHRSPVPVEVVAVPGDRLPAAVEAAAYYIIAEAITNVAKYAEASHVAVSVSRFDAGTLVEVSDDGIGGADPGAGSGLRGIADRVEALNGHFAVTSPPGMGTTIRAEIPPNGDADL
jgi:signal transduction histidine kinase